jgi:beta-galactosidase
MFHDGPSFGMMAGASESTGNYRDNVISYDCDAPLDEAGHPTQKLFAYRDINPNACRKVGNGISA